MCRAYQNLRQIFCSLCFGYFHHCQKWSWSSCLKGVSGKMEFFEKSWFHLLQKVVAGIRISNSSQKIYFIPVSDCYNRDIFASIWTLLLSLFSTLIDSFLGCTMNYCSTGCCYCGGDSELKAELSFSLLLTRKTVINLRSLFSCAYWIFLWSWRISQFIGMVFLRFRNFYWMALEFLWYLYR